MSENHLSLLRATVGNHLWQSTAFACAVWLMTLTLSQNSARLRYGLWVAASLKFLLPFSLLLGLGGLLRGPQTMSVRNDQFVLSIATTAMRPLQPHDSLPTKDESGATSRIPSLYAATVAVWFCGILYVLSVRGIHWRRLQKTLNDSVRLGAGREYEAFHRVGGHIPLHLSRSVMEPSVYGVSGSVLLWPEGLSDRLDDEHLAAIMLHELTHVRHCDNLIAAVHMVVEAIFWFHPLVWWMERKLLTERENVCDESVIQSLGNAQAYAFGLLKVSRYCVESELPCVAGLASSDLRNRVTHIVTYRNVRLSPARFLMLIGFGLATFVIPLALGLVHPLPVYGQILYQEGALPSFEVTSVKPRPNGPPPTPAPQGGSTVHLFFTTKMLIMYAYNLPDFSEEQITKDPGWMDETYDVEGKISDADYVAIQKMPEAERREQIQLRLQSLLRERFNLKVHLEKREQTIYALEVAKGGPKLSAAKHELPDHFGVNHSGMEYELKATGTDLDELASLLGRQPEVGGRSTVNRTGLSGKYDLVLHWTRTGSTTQDAGSLTSEMTGPSYFTAIQQQLGLRLTPAKGQVHNIVVDHIEKPSTN